MQDMQKTLSSKLFGEVLLSNFELFLDKVFKFIKETLPGFLAAYFLGKASKQKEVSRAEAKLAETELKLEYKNNEDAIEKKYSGMSDDDIISDAVKGPTSKHDN